MKNEVLDILSTGLFKRIIAGETIKIAEINAAIAILIKADIAFDMFFAPSGPRVAKELSLVIYITPSVTIRILIQFESGSTIL